MSEFEFLKNEVHSINNMLEAILKKLCENESRLAHCSECRIENKGDGRTLFAWLDEWVRVYKRSLKERSLKNIQGCINNHIRRGVEDKPLCELTGLDIQNALNRIQGSRTRKYTFDVFSAALKQATLLGILNKNPMQSVDAVRHKRQCGRALSSAEQQHFLQILADNKKRAYYQFLLLTGCRKSEALNMLWSDVNFERRTVHVRGTKSSSSNRLVPLFKSLECLLMQLERSEDRLFPFSASSVECDFKRLKKKHSLCFRIHDLRHTFATNCLERGVSPKTIQKWLGHSKLDVTMNIYTHIQSDFEESEVKRVDQ